MITTTKGDMDESLLNRQLITIENDKELTQVIEYYLEDELVHRSVHIQLKQNVVCESIAAQF